MFYYDLNPFSPTFGRIVEDKPMSKKLDKARTRQNWGAAYLKRCPWDPKIYWDYYLIRRRREIAIQWTDPQFKKSRRSVSAFTRRADALAAAKALIQEMKEAGVHTGTNFDSLGNRLIDHPETNDLKQIRTWEEDWQFGTRLLLQQEEEC